MSKHIFYLGDVREMLKKIPSKSVQCVVTSPPYWGLRDYGVEGQLGLENTPEEYVANMVKVFREVWRVLRDDGTVWLNLGDTMANKVVETDEMELRDDLTKCELLYVLKELEKYV